ncbi:MAG TPA: hypothetical protein DD473_21215 [Planctomycetaceae bacterium]|nr:hypothetical protein [Planctomycetaceae bacterium]
MIPLDGWIPCNRSCSFILCNWEIRQNRKFLKSERMRHRKFVTAAKIQRRLGESIEHLITPYAEPVRMNWADFRKELLTSEPQIAPPDLQVIVLPDVIFRVVRAAQREDASANEVGKIIDTDSSLTCDLLKYVNSSAMMLRHKAATASRATMLLGVKRTKLFVLSLASNRMMRNVKSPLILMKRFAVSSLERALFSKMVAGHLGMDEDLAFSAGLMQDLVLPALTADFASKYSDLLELSEESQTDLAKLEQQELGWDHASAAARMMDSWGFPEDLVCCVFLHHQLDRILQDKLLYNTELLPVAMSGLLNDLFKQTPNGMQKLEQVWNDVLPAVSLPEQALVIYDQLQEMNPEFHGHQSLAEHLAVMIS